MCLYYGKHGDLSQLPGDPRGHVSTSKGIVQWGRKIIVACFGTGPRWQNREKAGNCVLNVLWPCMFQLFIFKLLSVCSSSDFPCLSSDSGSSSCARNCLQLTTVVSLQNWLQSHKCHCPGGGLRSSCLCRSLTAFLMAVCICHIYKLSLMYGKLSLIYCVKCLSMACVCLSLNLAKEVQGWWKGLPQCPLLWLVPQHPGAGAASEHPNTMAYTCRSALVM